MIAPRLTLVQASSSRWMAACDCGWWQISHADASIPRTTAPDHEALLAYQFHVAADHRYGPMFELSLSTEHEPAQTVGAAEDLILDMLDAHTGYRLSSSVTIGRTSTGDYIAYATMTKGAP